MVALTAFNSIPVLKKVCTATTKSLPITGHAFWKKEAENPSSPGLYFLENPLKCRIL
jgi:hypothetical protein